MFLEIHCDQGHHGLFGAPEKRVCWVGRWREIRVHHQSPSSSEVHFHPGCSTPCPVCCFAACMLKSQCWYLVVVVSSVFGVQSGFLCIVGSFVTLGHF